MKDLVENNSIVIRWPLDKPFPSSDEFIPAGDFGMGIVTALQTPWTKETVDPRPLVEISILREIKIDANSYGPRSSIRWYPASEPPARPLCVLSWDQETHFIACYEGGKWMNAHTDEPIDSVITHWAPLPEPKGE